jgi:hypothetical protein
MSLILISLLNSNGKGLGSKIQQIGQLNAFQYWQTQTRSRPS